MRVTRPGLLIAVAAVLSVAAVHRSAPPQIVNGPFDPPGTFSVLGFDPATGAIGAAVQSRVFSVGNGVLWAEAGVAKRQKHAQLTQIRQDFVAKVKAILTPEQKAKFAAMRAARGAGPGGQ